MPDLKALKDKLKYDPSTFSKLVKIGNDDRLEAISEHLPARLSIIYLIAQLDAQTLKAAVKKASFIPVCRGTK